jgi:hypothetical protein
MTTIGEMGSMITIDFVVVVGGDKGDSLTTADFVVVVGEDKGDSLTTADFVGVGDCNLGEEAGDELLLCCLLTCVADGAVRQLFRLPELSVVKGV